MEVAPKVHRVVVGQGAFVGVYAPNVYLVAGDSRAAFIDTAYGKDEEVQAQLELWESLGKPQVEAIVLTHRHGDHIGGAARLQEATGGPIVSSPAEKGPIESSPTPVEVGRVAADGDTVDLGDATLELIHTPGHTMGSMCVYFKEEAVLFTGDTILGTGTTVVNPGDGDMGSYMDSLSRLMGYGARLICPGHGPVVNQPAAKIQELVDHRLERERQILGLLEQGQRTVEGLFKAIYPELQPRLHDTARSQVRSHLLKLEKERQVVALEGDAFQIGPARG